MKTKIYALCGVFWFAMDSMWYIKLYSPAFIFGVLTLLSSIAGLLIRRKTKTEFYIVLATFAWIMINMCSLSLDMFPVQEYEKLNNILKLFGFLFMIVGVVSLLTIGFTNRDLLEKFKKL